MREPPSRSDALWRRLQKILFVPILAGATLRDRMIACLGALIGIGVTGAVCSLVAPAGSALPYLVAPVGASSVLLFAVPASPLAQPWPIIGGNTLSALVGILVARLVHQPMLATVVAVGLAIAVMSLTRCLHPPGGAAALTGVIGGPQVVAAGLSFALVPVCLNSALLVLIGWAFHKLTRHAYPHVPAMPPVNTHGTRDPPPQLRVGFRKEDVDAALEDLHEVFDIDRDDLDRLLQRVELKALARTGGAVASSAIMSRDVLRATPAMPAEEARAMLLEHGIRTLPVVDGDGRLVGIVGLREVASGGTVGEAMATPVAASPETPAMELVPRLTDGKAHAVVIVDDDGRILGLVTQTDLLATLAKLPALAGGPA
jgi:CBS domain-containing membrane protein